MEGRLSAGLLPIVDFLFEKKVEYSATRYLYTDTAEKMRRRCSLATVVLEQRERYRDTQCKELQPLNIPCTLDYLVGWFRLARSNPEVD